MMDDAGNEDLVPASVCVGGGGDRVVKRDVVDYGDLMDDALLPSISSTAF